MTVAEYLTATGGTIAGTPHIPGLPTAIVLGSTMRDLFACHALMGLLASPELCGDFAERSYALADAMLAERRKVVRDEEAPAAE